ncbi:MAG TPA: MerR family transcriptional regulator [Chthoniobacterales bacterium]|nr:MerR family transcriptional regulator [Chthoniobacterales bacterium]
MKAPTREIELFDPSPNAVYTIEAAAHLVDTSRRTILVYCKHRLLSPMKNAANGAYSFDRNNIRALRRIEALRRVCGDDLAGIRMILELTEALENLHSQLRAVSAKPAAREPQDKSRRDREKKSSRSIRPKTNPRRKRK